MYSIWVSLKQSSSACSCRPSDIRQQPRRPSKGRYERVEESVESLNLKKELLLKRQHSQKDYTQERFYELSIGDPSRNVIEMIFRTAYMNQSQHNSKIERVLRVRNSTEVLKRFEEYREVIKKRAYEYDDQHMNSHDPRLLVDGNEVLHFYTTAMTCCSRKQQKVSKVCQNQMCGLCRMIQSSFDSTDNTKKKGIQLSTTIDTRSDEVSVSKSCNLKKAVVVCRVIAGRVANNCYNKVEGERTDQEEFDSVGSKSLRSKLEYLFVRNSNAVLPCFAIVYL